ncbi:MAG: C10 family peptidase, partial [Prevotella sp.]|nr:C10 family peptidase [Prevotella sp.]
MKKILLLMLSFVMVTMVKAEGITPQQALEQARNFIQKRENNGSRPRKAPGTAASRLVMAKQVNGLYVFKMAKNEGFVIVSNDDRTEPILGYSDSGNFDPDNMPDNMRAWLQGYADQIAWLNEHGVENAVATLPTLTGTPVKHPIEPLISTRWNQDTPYNDLAPEYAAGEKSATGCVATAMAQVMNYHKWPETQTAALSGYTKDYSGATCVAVDAVPATTFDWNNMIDDYRSGYTAAQGTAVATLMRYCGQSVKMNYGASSGANTGGVADALKNYFNYASTTAYKDRSFYTYA